LLAHGCRDPDGKSGVAMEEMIIMRNIITVGQSCFVDKKGAKTSDKNIFSKAQNNLNPAPRGNE
jgi:hypothetical protein